MDNCENCIHIGICRYEEEFKLTSNEVNNDNFVLKCSHKQDKLPTYNFREFEHQDYRPTHITCESVMEDFENGNIIC
jgi:hypothetical protein